MADGPEHWERAVLEKVALAAVTEQRRARRWGIFFKLAFLAYLVVLLAVIAGVKGGGEELPGGRHLAVVEVRGLIAEDSEASAQRVIDGLRDAFAAENAEAVVVVVNSPGGSPVQAMYIHDEIRRLKALHDKQVVAVVEDIGASGGYLVAVAADEIYVNPSSIVGSIGVRLDSFGFTGALEKLGIERRLFTAGANKGFLDPFLPLQEDQVVRVEKMLAEVHQHFVDAVRQGRGDRLRDDPEIFSGMVWSGTGGRELGLVDAFGSVDSVARESFDLERTVDYTPQEDVLDRLGRRLGAGMAESLARLGGQAGPLF